VRIGNPFAAKRGENHTILHLSKEEANNDNVDLPYPKFRNFKKVAAQIVKKHEEHVLPSTTQEESTQSYQPPHDSVMGPSVYPPAQQNPQPFYKPDYQFGYPQGKSKIFSGGYGEYHNSQWILPPAWTESGVMLVLPTDPGLWSKVISRWKSITINRLNNQTWSDNKAKLAFVENLLGESEKLMWQQWRTVFPEAYSALETITDEPQNITSQVRQLIMLEDPYHSSTDEQDRAYKDLDKITYEETKNLWSFLEDFRQLATKSGRLSKQGNIARSAVYQELDLDDNWGIVSAAFNDNSVYSISEVEGDTHQSISVMVQDTPIEEMVFMAIGETVFIEEDDESDSDQEEEDYYHQPKQVQQMIRDQAKEYYESKAVMQKQEELWQSKESLLVRDLTNALKIIEQLRIEKESLEEQKDIEKERLEEQKDEEIRKLKAQLA
nr:TPA: orf y [Tanacetum cinerariifolium]